MSMSIVPQFPFNEPKKSYVKEDSMGAAWSRRPVLLSNNEKNQIIQKIKKQLTEKNAVLIAHYYVDGEIQDLALETGGCVADSLEMARFGKNHDARQLIVAGVHFMGETAKILSPEKYVCMPDLAATCSLDIGCPPEEFSEFCARYPDRKVVVYANTSAAVKAQADWVVTSSCALAIVHHLTQQGDKILWAPDQHLGRYVKDQTGADLLIWDGACVVHDEFKATELALLRAEHPHAQVLVHPESPRAVVALADVVGSTAAMIRAVVEGSATEYIVATDGGILHRMQQLAPHKTFIQAPTSGHAATCKSCAYCPWMAMNGLQGILSCLETGAGEIVVDAIVRKKALVSITRMLDFTSKYPNLLAQAHHGFVKNIGVV